MFNIHRIRALALIIAVVGLLATSVIPGAASTTLSVDLVYCSSLGGGSFECYATLSGGTGPYTYTWTPTPVVNHGYYMTGNCTVGRPKVVHLTVTDSTGATDSQSGSFQCTQQAQ